MSDKDNITVGKQVVYPSHGVGQVTAEETQIVGGQEFQVYVIFFEKDKMTLRVPKSRAKKAGLRTLSIEDHVDKAIAILKGRAKAGRGMWSRRAQDYMNKINSGDIIAIAEVVRDLHKNVDDPDRSYSERVIYESALNRLADEYAAVKDVDTIVATNSLEDILKVKLSKAANKNKPQDEDDDEYDDEDDTGMEAA